MVEIVGDPDPCVAEDLAAFADLAAEHPWAGEAVGRMVVAKPDPAGLPATMRRALAQWMPRPDFERWEAEQAGRPVATAGKVFTAQDGVPTAVVFPVPAHASVFLATAAHELLELCHRNRTPRNLGRNDARCAHGGVLADEYVIERVRIEIATELGWQASPVDARTGLVFQTNAVVDLLRRPPFEGVPTNEFWQHWVNIARVWAMTSGRADAGAGAESDDLIAWGDHPLIADAGWSPARESLRMLYGQPELARDSFVDIATARIWDPIEMYGRRAWAQSTAS